MRMSHCYDSSYDSDAYDSDESTEEMKNNKWYFVFFTTLDNHTVEEINDPERLWRCPACQNRTGAIRKFKGLYVLNILHPYMIPVVSRRLHPTIYITS
ncbi:SUPPRESSOR OF SILENCING 3 [Artemisia annua]|uniref:SUPPRESSOR OF SILENCING 3 n=1 Tax=Artemisia annua TaxID=35608 RepID=A0A2U1N8U5_ARTAN|nr:SUPPRESSOR OF SILENCING 3 [Artemisia annua]